MSSFSRFGGFKTRARIWIFNKKIEMSYKTAHAFFLSYQTMSHCHIFMVQICNKSKVVHQGNCSIFNFSLLNSTRSSSSCWCRPSEQWEWFCEITNMKGKASRVGDISMDSKSLVCFVFSTNSKLPTFSTCCSSLSNSSGSFVGNFISGNSCGWIQQSIFVWHWRVRFGT